MFVFPFNFCEEDRKTKRAHQNLNFLVRVANYYIKI